MPIASSTDGGAVVPGIPDPRQRARGPSGRAGTALLLAVGVVFLLLATVSPAVAVTIRWASSSGIIHVTGPGTATLSEIAAAQPHAPLTLVDPDNAVWELAANLYIEEGAELLLHGRSIGGDVDQLRLQSLNTPAGGTIVFVSARWGTIDIRSTSITSWDDAVNGPDTEFATQRRSFLQARSFLDADGVTPHESRMDIIDSDVGYLGFQGSEAYGLSWKVLGGTLQVLDQINVFGDIRNSHIHHNYFGVYTFGAFGSTFDGNEMDHNVLYGFDLHDDSDQMTLTNNVSHDNGKHGIIASKRCDHVVIRDNRSYNNVGIGKIGIDKTGAVGVGIMLHRGSNDCVIENNEVFGNVTGITIFDSDRNAVRGNSSHDNLLYGIRLSVGSADNTIEQNDIAFNPKGGLYLYKGSDLPTQGDGHPKGNSVVANMIHDNTEDGLKATDADDNTFTGNAYAANGEMVLLQRGLRNRFDGDTMPDDGSITAEDNSSTFVSHQASTRIALDPTSVVVFDDERGAVFQPDQPGIATLVSPRGSMLRLTNALVGNHALVLTLPLFAVPPSQTVKVTPVDWPTSGDGQRTWMTAGPSNELVRYVVGGLVPNGAYVVRKGSVPVAVVTADASGTIAFSNAPGTTRPVTYSVAPVGSLVDPPIVSLPPHDNHGHATATETATTISKEQQRRGA